MTERPAERRIGRAASPYRPGLFIKEYLVEHEEGSVSDIYKGYCGSLPIPAPKTPFAYRRKRSPFAPTYASFARYFHFFKQLGLVELVLDMETGNPKAEPPGDVAEALWDKIQWKHFYRLTPKGALQIEMWQDPRSYFR